MAGDPYRYFRPEARELLDGLVAGVIDLEKGGAGKDGIARLLRLAHTLKGAARVVKQPAIAELAHAIEELLAPHRAGDAPERAHIDELLRLCDGIGAGIKALGGEPTGAAPAEPRSTDDGFGTVRVELAEMDGLRQGIAEASVQLTALRLQETRPDESRRLEQIERELVQVRDTADRMRLLPASVLFGTLERTVRDAAQSVGRQAAFQSHGGEQRADANVLSKLGAALVQLVRNAVAHGIEDAAQRAAAGKPPVGVVELTVERRGSRLAFTCRDDGGGIDVAAVRAVAIRRGLVPVGDAGALGLDHAVQLLLRGGVSTTAVATQTSGRGVGLDVVRAVADELQGEVTVRSAARAGTTIELLVPVTLSSVAALQVESAGAALSLPLAAVKQVVRVEPGGLARAGGRESLVFEAQSIPFLPMARALGRPARNGAAHPRCAVIVRAGESLTAIGVDRLLGVAEVVVRALPSSAAADPVVVGASLDAEGNPCLLLDPDELARAARREQPHAEGDGAAAQRLPVLVVDDSLTTRMLEQSILESAGYQVDLATSAEEALEQARARRYGLFLVDVEMPGMDGFEFVTRTRADPALRDTPAILVTSRAAVEDRRRGADVGARAYIVKSEFDQGRLLETIRGLLG